MPFLDPRPADDVQWKLAYDPPLSVEATGSWPLGAACKWKGADGWSVDLAVRMPDASSRCCLLILALRLTSSQSLLQANDVKAYRYFHKRAYYVACLAAALQESPLARHLAFTFGQLNGDARKPIIEIRSKKGVYASGRRFGQAVKDRVQIRAISTFPPFAASFASSPATTSLPRHSRSRVFRLSRATFGQQKMKSKKPLLHRPTTPLSSSTAWSSSTTSIFPRPKCARLTFLPPASSSRSGRINEVMASTPVMTANAA